MNQEVPPHPDLIDLRPLSEPNVVFQATFATYIQWICLVDDGTKELSARNNSWLIMREITDFQMRLLGAIQAKFGNDFHGNVDELIHDTTLVPCDMRLHLQVVGTWAAVVGLGKAPETHKPQLAALLLGMVDQLVPISLKSDAVRDFQERLTAQIYFHWPNAVRDLAQVDTFDLSTGAGVDRLVLWVPVHTIPDILGGLAIEQAIFRRASSSAFDQLVDIVSIRINQDLPSFPVNVRERKMPPHEFRQLLKSLPEDHLINITITGALAGAIYPLLRSHYNRFHKQQNHVSWAIFRQFILDIAAGLTEEGTAGRAAMLFGLDA